MSLCAQGSGLGSKSSCAALAMVALVGCAYPQSRRAPSSPRPLPSGKAGVHRWRALRRALGDVQKLHRPAPRYKMQVQVKMSHQHGLANMQARGAVAIAPNALRMVLLGPGGTTLLDFWSCGSAYRFSLPAIGFLGRSNQPSPHAMLPVQFLRYWFLEPMRGRLLFADDGFWLLRDPSAHTRIAQRGDLVTVERFDGRQRERIRATGGACGKVVYQQPDLGLTVSVTCEKLELTPAPVRAFNDPDRPTRPCPLTKEGA